MYREAIVFQVINWRAEPVVDDAGQIMKTLSQAATKSEEKPKSIFYKASTVIWPNVAPGGQWRHHGSIGGVKAQNVSHTYGYMVQFSIKMAFFGISATC